MAERVRGQPGRAAWLLLSVVVLAGVALDQLTKGMAARALFGQPFRVLVPGLLELRFGLNAGVAFGLGQDLPAGIRAAALVALAGAGVLALLWLFSRTGAGEGFARLAIALAVAGGVGNAIDRLRRGEVIDFIHLRVGDSVQFGTFNVADALIAIGLVPLIASAFRSQTSRSG